MKPSALAFIYRSQFLTFNGIRFKLGECFQISRTDPADANQPDLDKFKGYVRRNDELIQLEERYINEQKEKMADSIEATKSILR